jgi:hypothetical protein
VPTDASPAAIAQILVASLRGRLVRGGAVLPSWDSAAASLADVYLDAARARPHLPGV